MKCVVGRRRNLLIISSQFPCEVVIIEFFSLVFTSNVVLLSVRLLEADQRLVVTFQGNIRVDGVSVGRGKFAEPCTLDPWTQFDLIFTGLAYSMYRLLSLSCKCWLKSYAVRQRRLCLCRQFGWHCECDVAFAQFNTLGTVL